MKRFILALILLLVPTLAVAQPHWGDRADGGTLYFYTNTLGQDGAGETPASEAISVYKDNSDTQLTTGATIDDDVDSLTGFHRISIDTTQTGFDVGSHYTIVYSAGTSDSVSVTGRIIGTFTLGIFADTDDLDTSIAADGELTRADIAFAQADIDSILDDTGTSGVALAANVITNASIHTDTRIGIDWAKVANPATAVGLDNTNTGAVLEASQVTTFAPGSINTAAFADGAITGAKFGAGVLFDPGADTVTVAALEQAALAQFSTDDTGETVPVAGSVAALGWATAARTITGGTITTYTGNTPQTGDGYAIANSGVHGNAAMNTRIVDMAGSLTGIQQNIFELHADWDDGGRLDLILDARASQASVDGVPTTAEFDARTILAADYFVVGDYTAPLNAAGIRTAVGLATANLDTQLADIPTVAEFNARSILAADYFIASDYTAPLTAAQTQTEAEDALAAYDAATGAEVAAVKAETALIFEDTGITLPAAIDGIEGGGGGGPSTRDLKIAAENDTWDMVQRAGGIRSLNPVTIYQGETKKFSFDCKAILATSDVMADMTAPTSSVANLTPTKIGVGPTWASVDVACGAAVAAGTYTIRTTIETDETTGPQLLIGTITVLED